MTSKRYMVHILNLSIFASLNVLRIFNFVLLPYLLKSITTWHYFTYFYLYLYLLLLFFKTDFVVLSPLLYYDNLTVMFVIKITNEDENISGNRFNFQQ